MSPEIPGMYVYRANKELGLTSYTTVDYTGSTLVATA